MFRFENPIYLYLLVLIPILALIRFYVISKRRKKLKKFGDPELLKALMPDVSRFRPEVKFWLLMAALALLIVMLARPQMGTKISREKRNGIEAMIAVDISNSMKAEDVVPSRLDKSKMLIERMVDNFTNDKVGLVVFAGDAFIQLPITSDYVSAKMFLQNTDPSLIATQGTNIAEAINISMNSFTQQEKIGRAIIVITDGEDHEGGAVEAAQAALKKGMRVFVLGVGSTKGSPIPDGEGGYMKDNSGQEVMSALNEQMCKDLAKAGGGAYIHVDNTNAAQEQLNDELTKLQKGELSSVVYSEYDEQFQAFGILVLLLLIIPEISKSVSGIVKELPSQIETLTTQLQNKTLFDNSSPLGEFANNKILEALNGVVSWLTKDLFKQWTTFLDYFKSVAGVIYNLVIGLILSMYITIDREKLQNQIKKLTYSILPTKRALNVRIMFNRANKKLSTAIRGKIVDSLIIGMIHFILLSFANLLPWFNYPYPVLLATIVGITNVVPFFGPIVGGVITGVLVLFENPSMTIPYVIMVVILQQFDGNFLDPHIVGGSIGLRPLWSISACLLGNAIIGVPGFVLGPPLVSFVYELVREACDQRLREKHLEKQFGLPSQEELAEQQSPPRQVQPETKRLGNFVQSNAEKFSDFIQKMKKDK